MPRPAHSHLRLAAVALGALALALALLPWPPAPAALAQVSGGGSFGSAVPCLLGESVFATTCAADTIAAPVSAADPALVEFSASGKGAMRAPLGARSGAGADSDILSGIGSTYGLAYDDGAVSGRRRLLAAAYTKRLVSFGPGGPGGIYEYSYSSGQWRLTAVVPNAWNGGPARSADDYRDRAIIGQVGKTSLGDMEIAPDGRALYVTNLAARQIERFDISAGPLVRQPPLAIDYGQISSSPAVQADLRPFALEFSPRIVPNGPALMVGVTDTAQRGGTATPRAYVLTYLVGANSWRLSLAQSLTTATIASRFAFSTYDDQWSPESAGAWNRWIDAIDSAPTRITTVPSGEVGSHDDVVVSTLLYPQPILSDIEFNRDGSRLFLGLRDRSGDQTYFRNAPHPEKLSIAQGDTLAYRAAGESWQLLTVSRTDPMNEDDSADLFPAAGSDYFNDSLHAYGPAAEPPHPENHMGALATSLRGGPGGLGEQVVVPALLGGLRSGFGLYGEAGGQRASYTQLIGAGDAAGGKAAALGDVELLCSYAFVGGRIWQDIDGDGVQDAGEPPFANLTLELFKGGDLSAPALARATTGADGRYLFAVEPNTAFNLRLAPAAFQPGGPAAGWYFTRANSGGSDTADSDAHEAYGYIEFFGAGLPGSGLSGTAQMVRPRESDERSFDIGLTRVAATGQIGDRVWDDASRNGLQDAGERGMGGLTVTLERDSATSAAPPLGRYPATAVTQPDGSYSFAGVEPGRYRVRFSQPAGYGPTLPNAGGNDALDSDADTASGLATAWVLIAQDDPATPAREDRVLTLDFGLLNQGADVSVAKAGPAQALVGQTFSYSLSYRNNGPAPASDVQLVDTLPAGLTYISASPAPATRAGATLTWNLGTLAAGQQGAISVQVRAPASLSPAGAVSQSVTNRATISASSPDPNPDNNSSTVATLLVRPELGIAKAAAATALVGDELTYTLSYRNAGGVAAAGVLIADPLPVGLGAPRFIVNPGGACGYDALTREVSCSFASLPPGASGQIQLAARVEPGAPGSSLSNTATISTSTPGDDPADNSSTSVTLVQRPNPGVAISLGPSPFPVGTGGTVTARYGNGLSAAAGGLARNSTLTVMLGAGTFTLGALPAGCSYSAASRTIVCALGDLPSGATGARVFPIALSADSRHDSLSASATINSTTPERPADQADNSASASVVVVRPNVFVSAEGPASIVGQGSAFWYRLGYGNLYRRNPSLTHMAEGVVLQATLPADVSYVGATVEPSAIEGNLLTWELGTLREQEIDWISVIVQTAVPAGASLELSARISTVTPGDNPADNRDSVLTDVVQPPAAIPAAQGDLRLAIRSELDPNSQDGDPRNGVYLSEGLQIAWPAGEVLDFTPRLSELRFADEPLPFPYEYRARVTGWSVAGFELNGVSRDPTAPDSRGLSGCRNGRRPSGSALAGCAYDYPGGATTAAIRAGEALSEAQLAGQAHVYWTQPPAPTMRRDVYLYTVDPLGPARIRVQVEVEVWIVNAYPGEIGGVPLPEIPVAPLPDPERRLIGATFDVTLLAPRSLVGPGSLGR